MKTMRVFAVSAFAAFMAMPALAATDIHMSVNLSNAPPPPVVVVQHPPRTVWLPETRVYVADDGDYPDDYFEYGAFWYVYRNDYWYRARSWRGPYAVIDTRYVPQSIMVVPARHWKHHPMGGPPGQMRYVEHRGPQVERVKVKSHGNGRDNDQGNGHGRGHNR